MCALRPNFRIVSLVPSLTETLCYLGLQDQVVGSTNFCILPKTVRSTSDSIGGTKDVDIQRVIALNPTHIVANTEENTKEILDTLKTHPALSNCMLIETFPKNPKETVETVLNLAKTFQQQTKILDWCDKVTRLLEKSEKKQSQLEQIPFLYFIWREPWMCAGNDTYISHMLKAVGLQNVLMTSDNLSERYPVVQLQDESFQNILRKTKVVFFSSEPFPFKIRHINEFKIKSECGPILLEKIDGRLASWYGIRTLEGLEYLTKLSVNLLDSLKKASV